MKLRKTHSRARSLTGAFEVSKSFTGLFLGKDKDKDKESKDKEQKDGEKKKGKWSKSIISPRRATLVTSDTQVHTRKVSKEDKKKEKQQQKEKEKEKRKMKKQEQKDKKKTKRGNTDSKVAELLKASKNKNKKCFGISLEDAMEHQKDFSSDTLPFALTGLAEAIIRTDGTKKVGLFR